MDYIRSFSQVGAGDIGMVGGKGANLGEMTQAGLPVPPGFCLTAAAYRAFVDSTGAAADIRAILDGLTGADAGQVDERSERIRACITARVMPADIVEQVLNAYRQLAAALGQPAGTPVPVAVRSSATAEDLPTASFAGQQDTYLNVRGEPDLLEHVKRCWASLWTARAVNYRIKQGFAHEQVALSVIVQAMIESEVAGIMFTANPVSGNRDEVVINASWGLGEAIVSGLVTPDTLTVRKQDGAIVSRQIASKAMLIQYAPQGGTVELEVPAERRASPALNDEQVAQLASLSGRIEAHYKRPMDIEWGCTGGRFYILQARPITTLKTAGAPAVAASAAAKGEYNRTMFVEIFSEPVSPIFLSVLKPDFHAMLDFTFETLGFKPPHNIEAVGVFYNQPYFHREYIEGALKPLSPPVREQLVAQIVNPFSRRAGTGRTELSPSFAGMALRLLRFLTGFPSMLPGIVARYHAEIKAFEAIDLPSASDRTMVERVRELALGTGRRFLSYDFLMIAMMGITYQALGTMLVRYFGDESEQVRTKLITGVTGNVTMQTNKKIWDLAQVAKRSPAVAELLRKVDGEALRTQLAQTSDGQAFLAELQHFLADYGHRESRLDILYPTWVEDASPVLAFVRGYLDAGDNQSPYYQQDRLVAQRGELMTTVRERLQRDWRGRLLVWPLFTWLLRHTQANTRERDTMHFELTRLFPPMRRTLLELGRRWTTSGVLDKPDDIFYLTLDELLQVADSHKPQQALVQARRAELESSRRRPAPGIIRDGQAVAVEGAVQAVPGAGEFHGIAGSPGLATGLARLVLGPEDFGKLKNGEILVAPITNPVWTPLFAIAGGIVTEIGGILSHGAIVAREYGIPAVMGVPGVTAAIAEGKRVTVDGNRGLVTVET